MKQQRATLEKRNAPRNKSGDAVGRPSCRSSLLGDPGAKFLVETGHRNRTMKNSLNYVSTCLKIVDTRRYAFAPIFRRAVSNASNCFSISGVSQTAHFLR